MMSRATCVIPADASKSFKACSYIRYPISSPWLCPYQLNLWNSQLLFLLKKQVFLLTLQQVPNCQWAGAQAVSMELLYFVSTYPLSF